MRIWAAIWAILSLAGIWAIGFLNLPGLKYFGALFGVMIGTGIALLAIRYVLSRLNE